MLSQTNRLPVEINASKATATVEIVWDDDHRSLYKVGELRAICPCATCREAKGEKPHQAIGPKPSPEAKVRRSLPLFKAEKYQITSMHYVGNYALGVDWQDSHHSIYTWKLLSEECLCEACSNQRNLLADNDSNMTN